MRRSNAGSGGHGDFPVFRISPVLEHFGGEEALEGYGWKAYKCPFHGDRQASASVNTMDQLFNCHAADCPKGNAVQIIMKEEGKSYREAVERAEEISGASDASVSRSSGRSSRRSGGSRTGSGSRAFKRTWSST